MCAVRLLIIPHAVAGVGIVVFALYLITTLLAGTNVLGTITKMERVPDSEGGPRHTVHFDYSLRNEKFHATGVTVKEKYNALKVGDNVNVRIMPLSPGLGPLLMDGCEHWSVAIFTLVFGTVWSALISVMCYVAFVGPHHRTKVMKYGKVLLGTITDKLITGEDHNQHTLRFQYEPVPGQYQTNDLQVTAEQYAQAQIGERVTVLHDPKYANHSFIYRYSDYELKPTSQA